MLLFSANLHAQPTPTVSLPHVVESPGLVYIPVVVNFNHGGPFCSADFKIDYDPDVLQFLGINNNNSGVGGNFFHPTIPATPPIQVGWFDPTDEGTSMQGNFVQLIFHYSGGDSDLVFMNLNEIGESAIFSCDDETTPTTTSFFNGSITEQTTPPLVPLPGLAVLFGFGFITLFVAIRAFKS